jgi:hypothetical protein
MWDAKVKPEVRRCHSDSGKHCQHASNFGFKDLNKW